TNEDSTRVYSRNGSTGVSGGFAVGRYGAAKGEADSLFFFTNIDSTRVYTDGGVALEASGGFAVGRYGAAKNVANTFFHTAEDSTRVYIPDSGTAGVMGGFAVTGNNTGVTDDYFNVTGNDSVELINNKKKIMWYPQKSAFLGGEIHVGSVDSVGENSVALGFRSIAMGNWSQAFGYKSKALGTYSTAIGFEAESDTNSFALGYSAKATGNDAFALGEASAEGNNSYAFGSPGKLLNGSLTERPKATGEYSYAFGSGTVSSGDGAFSIGVQDTSSGDFSVAIGYISKATDRGSVAIGSNLVSSGWYSFASGYYSIASGSRSVAMGYGSTASGYSSFAAGRFNEASGSYSTAFGRLDTASGYASTVFGIENTASGFYSTVFGQENKGTGYNVTSMGYCTTAQSYASLVIGQFNVVTGTTTSWESAEPLFVAGNGTSETVTHNAMTLYKDGYLNINDAYTFPNADGTIGQVLQTNGSGTVSWVGTSSFGNDNLGNHSATQDLDMNAHDVTDVRRIITQSSNDYDKLRVWGSSSYTIGMRSAMSLGYLNDYAMTFTMNTDADRGWVWRDVGDAQTDGAMSLTTDGRLYVKSTASFNGDVGIGITAPTQKLQVVGNVYASGGDFYAASGNGVINCGGGIMNASVNVIGDNTTTMGYAGADDDLYIREVLEVDGACYKTGTGTWTVQSDKRLKKDIREYKDGLNQILKINPVFFKYNEKAGVSGNKEYIGIIAQDIKDIAPYTVELTPFKKVEIEDESGKVVRVEWDGEEYYTFDPSALTFMLINGIKEQQTQIEEQNNKIENLERQIQELKDLISK
ncbi:MAG: tail fiber domain-containing protein, partial [Bacteroidales bacterium]|nr:tail fiber domain-containing protein [Bacteroidales bacterium]